jgi:hypothetical protein
VYKRSFLKRKQRDLIKVLEAWKGRMGLSLLPHFPPSHDMAYSTKAAQAFTSILDNEKDWEKRVISMGKMEETLKTDFGLDFTAKDILLFRSSLCAQINDNRTAVSKQACDLVTTLVRMALLEL